MRPRNWQRSDWSRRWRRLAIATKDATFFNRFGQLIYQEPLGRAAGYDHPQFSIHRGDLQMVLLDAFLARAGHDRLLTNHHCTGVEQDDAGVSVSFSDGPTGASHTTVRGRIAIACDGIHSAIRKAVLSGRRRTALFRRQHVARRDAVEADAVRRQHGAGGMAVAWQDGDLSDPPRRRRRTAAHQLGRGNRNAELSQARLDPAGLDRRLHRRLRRLAFRLARCAGLHPRRRQRAGISDGRSGSAAALEFWACNAARRRRAPDGAARLQRRGAGDSRCTGADDGAA